MTLPLRLASWATDCISGFLDALIPANHVEPCTGCGETTRAGVQPCTDCMYAAADELAEREAGREVWEPEYVSVKLRNGQIYTERTGDAEKIDDAIARIRATGERMKLALGELGFTEDSATSVADARPGEFEPHRAVPNMDGYCMVRLSNGDLCDLCEGNGIHSPSAVSASADPSPQSPRGDNDPAAGSPQLAAGSYQAGEVFAHAESNVLAALIAEVLAEHNPFDGAGGIECSPAWADFETPYGADHIVHLSGMAAWREHVAQAIAARIEKATADALSAAEFPQHTKK